MCVRGHFGARVIYAVKEQEKKTSSLSNKEKVASSRIMEKIAENNKI